ncbi:MAG: hypothetical protein LBS42_05720 [Tannerella sp.]|jgi:hypothetical protein|nr:hypothetical protein [Tannerella sp.]
MFYVRINKIKVFNNREGFLGLFNRAEMRIYGHVAGYSIGAVPSVPPIPPLTPADLIDLDDNARRQKLLDAVLSEAGRFTQSHSLEINGIKDNQTLIFDEAGLVLYQSETIPDNLHLQVWVIESDEDVRKFALDAEKVMQSDAFKGLVASVGAVLAETNPLLTSAIGVGGVAVSLLRQKLKANRDDLVGYWQATLNRAEHYPHGTRDRQDVYDSTGNIQLDYTLFGFDKTVAPDSESIINN